MMLDIDHLQARRGEFVVGPLTTSIGQGACLALIGANGAGKTTILETLAGFVGSTAGRIVLDGEDLSGRAPEHRHFAYLPQDLALFPHLDVTGNIAYAMRRRTSSERRAEIAMLLDEFELTAIGDHYPHQLSRGQAQRVAFARALAAHPRVLLLDEPTASLDLVGRRRFEHYLRRLLVSHHRGRRLAVIYATHNVSSSLSFATSAAVLDGGRVVQVGVPAQLFQHPADAYVAGLFGLTNQWEVEVTAETTTGTRIRLGSSDLVCEQASPAAARVVAAIGPGEIEVLPVAQAPATLGNRVRGTVEALQVGGQVALVDLHSAIGPIRAAVSPHQADAFLAGRECWVRLPAEKIRLVAASSNGEPGPPASAATSRPLAKAW